MVRSGVYPVAPGATSECGCAGGVVVAPAPKGPRVGVVIRPGFQGEPEAPRLVIRPGTPVVPPAGPRSPSGAGLRGAPGQSGAGRLVGPGLGLGSGGRLTPCAKGAPQPTWSAPTTLATLPSASDFDCCLQNARWIVRRESDGVVAVVYARTGLSGGLVVHLYAPETGTWSTVSLGVGPDLTRLFGADPSSFGQVLSRPAIATDGTDFYIAVQRRLNNGARSIATLRLTWSPASGRGDLDLPSSARWDLVDETSRELQCALPSIVWSASAGTPLLVYSGQEPGASSAEETNVYFREVFGRVSQLVDAWQTVGGVVRSKDMASISESDGRVVIAWRAVLQGGAGNQSKGVMAAVANVRPRGGWSSVSRTTLAGYPKETLEASDPCALALPDGRSMVGYWRRDRGTQLPQPRVSSLGSLSMWTMGGAMAPPGLPSGVQYHFFVHLEHDDCRVFGVWEGRRDTLSNPIQNGAYVSGSSGTPTWAVPTDAGYFEVPGTGEDVRSNALFPGFCTGGGALHLVWLETTNLTLRYATGVVPR